MCCRGHEDGEQAACGGGGKSEERFHRSGADGGRGRDSGGAGVGENTVFFF